MTWLSTNRLSASGTGRRPVPPARRNRAGKRTPPRKPARNHHETPSMDSPVAPRRSRSDRRGTSARGRFLKPIPGLRSGVGGARRIGCGLWPDKDLDLPLADLRGGLEGNAAGTRPRIPRRTGAGAGSRWAGWIRTSRRTRRIRPSRCLPGWTGWIRPSRRPGRTGRVYASGRWAGWVRTFRWPPGWTRWIRPSGRPWRWWGRGRARRRDSRR